MANNNESETPNVSSNTAAPSNDSAASRTVERTAVVKTLDEASAQQSKTPVAESRSNQSTATPENAEAAGEATILETLVEGVSDALPSPAPSKSETRKSASGTKEAPDQYQPTTPTRLADIPTVLGDYELLEELGRGGMGIVFRARQRSVNRQVALKVIRPDRLATMSVQSRKKSIERFQIEAEAASRVNHDHLVTVYEVGFDAGCHYFSMRYVSGTSLSELIRENPAENRQAAEWLEPICRAVHAVHACGVLHRDLKPHNILKDKETGKTLVTDFGLAKLADVEDGMTRTGEAIGTPAYMSPEQFRDASSVSVRTDVYSLGATLYHLLSGRPPFKAASSMQTMRQVLDLEALPLRRLNPAVDRDLETISMKCLEKEPSRRYATAQEVAEELQRYLSGRPIAARPIGAPERAWRWCRRNRFPATLIALTFFAIVFGVTSLAVSNVRTEAARQQSEASFQDAMSAVNDFFTRVSEERLLNEPGLQEVRRDLLGRAREYYAKFLNQREHDPSVRNELAATHYRLGLIVEELESPEAALDWFQRAKKLREQLRIAKQDDAEQRRHLSNIINAMGRAFTRIGKLDQAAEHFRDAERLREQLLIEAPDEDAKLELIRLHANCRMNLGLVERQQANGDAARELYELAQRDRRAALVKKPLDRALRRDIVKGEYNLANLAIDRSDEAGLKQHLTEALTILESLLAENPRDLEDQYLLSICYRMRADLFAALLDREPDAVARATDDYQHAIRITRKLSDLNPAVTKYVRELAGLAVNLGQLAMQQKQTDEALAQFRTAEKLLRSLMEQSSPTPQTADTELLQSVLATIQMLEPQP